MEKSRRKQIRETILSLVLSLDFHIMLDAVSSSKESTIRKIIGKFIYILGVVINSLNLKFNILTYFNPDS